MDRLLVCDIDGTFVGEPAATAMLAQLLRRPGAPILAFATGRQSYSATSALAQAGVDQGRYLIAGVGSELYRRIGSNWFPMASWPRVSSPWDGERIRRELRSLEALSPQDLAVDAPYKLSYVAAPEAVPAVRGALKRIGAQATVVHSHGDLLDVLPGGIDKGSAVLWLAECLGIPLDRVMTCGNTTNDEAMLRLACPSVVVGGSDAQLLAVAPSMPRTYVAAGACAWGIVEGLRHFGWTDGEVWS